MAGNPAAVDVDDELPGEPEPAARPEPKAKPAPKPAPAPAATAEPETPKPRRSKALLDSLAEFGYSEADIEGFSNEEVWEEVHNLRRSRTPAAAEPAARPVAPANPPEPESDPLDGWLAEFDKTDPVGGKFLRGLRDANKQLQTALKERDEKLDTLTKAEEQRQRRVIVKAIDAGFAALPEEYKALYGEGGEADLTDPGAVGWRRAVIEKAGVKVGDEPRAVAAKINATALKLAAGRVQPPEPTVADLYGGRAAGPKPKRQLPPQDPETGQFVPASRFSAADFNNGHVHRPSGRATGGDAADAVQQTERYLREHGDPRGNRTRVEFDDEDLPGDE